MSRPHYLPEIVWLGVIIGRWPIEAFPNEEKAKSWAGEAPWIGDRYEPRRIWSVAIPANTVVYSVEKVPASIKMKQEPSP